MIKVKSKSLVLFLILSLSSCTNLKEIYVSTTDNTKQLETTQYSDLDQEYSQFKTEALTQSYLKKKMDKWLSSSTYSKKLVREIEYAKFKHKDILKTIVAQEPTMFDSITADTSVTQKRSEGSFENYIQYIDPYPSPVVATSATNIASTSFTANWNAAKNANGYKLYLDGSATPITLGNVTTYDVTGLTDGSSHTYYIKAINNSGESQNSNTINTTLLSLAPVASVATSITTTSFTANWAAVNGATGYKFYLDGSATPTTLGNVTNYNVTGLVDGSSHTYSVKGTNNAGDSSVSNTTNVTLLSLAPVATAATSVTSASFIANWAAVNGATGYKLYLDGTPITLGNVTNYSVTGLVDGSSHTYYVKSVNAAGDSSVSNTINTTLLSLAPVATAATSVTTTSFIANWGAVTGATGYKIYLDGSATPITLGNVTNYSVTGLSSGTTHTYSVKVITSAGESLNSNTISVTSLSLTPVTTSASNITSSSFTANWGGVVGATGYKLYLDGSATPIILGNVITYDFGGLSSGTTHTYSVKATNAGGDSSISNTTSVTLSLSAPVATSATNITVSSFKANWGAVTGATGYKLYLDGSATPIVLGNVTNYNVTGLDSLSSHTYTVQATNALGASAVSNSISVTTLVLNLLTATEVQSLVSFTDSEYFTIGTDSYLAGSGATSKIYKWNTTTSQFVEIQSISTAGAMDCEYFTIGTDTYLAIANYANGTYDIDSTIYKWNTSTNQFVALQSIPTHGAIDWESFKIGTDTYLAIANSYSPAHARDSYIYKYNTSTKLFEQYQAIGTYGAYDWEYFTIGTERYLAIANHYNGGSYNVDTVIYKWNTSTLKFDITFESIGNTYASYALKEFIIGTDNYFVIGNFYSSTYVYKWNGSTFTTTALQIIPTSGSYGLDNFTLDGNFYLAVANYNANSTIYKWNTTTNQFVQAVSIASTNSMSIKYFKIGIVNYAAVVSQTGTSKIYRLD